MGRKIYDLTGKQFGMWKVIGRSESKRHPSGHLSTYWKCECQCVDKTIKDVESRNLRTGMSQSCGCLQKESVSKIFLQHGQSQTTLYHVWQNMIYRCSNPKNSNYSKYGGRGISVCNDWLSFEGFALWTSEQGIDENCCNSEGVRLTLERKEVDGNYEPSNCTWITKGDQSRNRRDTIRVIDNGVEKCLKDYCKDKGIPYSSVRYRLLKKNQPLEDVIRHFANRKSSR